MRLTVSSIALIAVALGLSGCAAPRGAGLATEILRDQDEADAPFQVVPVDKANLSDIVEWPGSSGAARYGWLPRKGGSDVSILKTGDRLTIFVWENEQNSLLATPGQKSVPLPTMTVSASGEIFMPYVGKIVVSGMTPDGARSYLEEQLAAVIPSAQVQVSVEAGTLNSVDLVSGVARPGTFPLPSRNFSVLSLLAQGGGIPQDLRNPVVRLLRDGKTYEVSAEKLMSDASLDTILRGGDKVLVEEDGRYFTALGASGTERLVYFEKDRITVLEALSMIGGLTDSRANPRGVLVLRNYSPKSLRQDGSGPQKTQVVFSIDLTNADGLFASREFQIQPNDTVLVTESPVVAAQSILSLIGSTVGIGNVVTN